GAGSGAGVLQRSPRHGRLYPRARYSVLGFARRVRRLRAHGPAPGAGEADGVARAGGTLDDGGGAASEGAPPDRRRDRPPVDSGPSQQTGTVLLPVAT